MSEPAGQINEYVCEKCRGTTRTVNRDVGTTPFMTQCLASPAGCDGMARSKFYRVNQFMTPGWEWIKPTDEEFEEYITSHNYEEHRSELKKYIEMGGMLLRKLDACRLEKYGFRLRRG